MQWRRLRGAMTTGIPQPRQDKQGQAYLLEVQCPAKYLLILDMMPPVVFWALFFFYYLCHVDVMGEGDGPDG